MSPRTAICKVHYLKPGCSFFLRLPREIRDTIYDFALLDIRQMDIQSRIYIQNLIFQRKTLGQDQPVACSPSMLTLGPFPTFLAPSMLRVSQQIRREALQSIYRRKVWVSTITSTGRELSDSIQSWLPAISCFWRIRLDFDLAQVAADTMSASFSSVSETLAKHAHSLRYLEIRISYSHDEASAALRDHGFALVVAHEDILRCMRKLKSGFAMRESTEGDGGYRPPQVSWGVSEAQRRVEDYHCERTYLNYIYLERLWSLVDVVDSDVESVKEYDSLRMLEEDCHTFGCRAKKCGKTDELEPQWQGVGAKVPRPP